MTDIDTTIRSPEAPKAPIDPRFRQRRIEVRRDEGRRRLRVLMILVGLMLAALLAWGITRPPLLNVDHLRVPGTGHTKQADISAVSGLHRGMAMFDVHVDTARARL